MDNVQRLDSAILERAEISAEGILKCPAQVTRPGIFTYVQDGKVRRELRRPEQVFHADSMATLQNKPFVNGHPYALGGEVTSRNARQILRGYTGGTAYKDGDNLCVDAFVCDEATIKEIKAGKVALSAGYTVKTIEEPGTWEGQRYDAEQVNIRYNHLALVKVGRAGKEAKLRLDEKLNQIPEQEPDMELVKIKLDSGKEIEVTQEVAAAFRQVGEFQAAAVQRADDAEAELLLAKNELTTLQGTVDGMKTRLDAIDGDKGKKEASEALRKQVRELSALQTQARAFLPAKDHARLDEMEPTEIMQAVIRADAGDQELKLDNNEAYLRGRYEQVILKPGKAVRNDEKSRELGKKILEQRTDEDADSETPEDRNARKKKEMNDRWKKPLKAGK